MRTLAFLVLITLLGSCARQPASVEKQYVVVLSMDGFRWDYTDKAPTPNFDKIVEMGVRAESLKSSFPTKTFPNHYAIATGLYPDNHGIISNSFFDPETGRYFSLFDRDAVGDGSFYGGEPIWVTAEKQGLITGSFFWVGSEAEINGYQPSYWKKYDHGFPYSQRIDSVIAWLQKSEETRPQLIMWYFDEPDHSGHFHGPDSPEMVSKITELDSLLGVFITRLNALPIAQQVNFIVLSDHGMSATSDERKVTLDDHLYMEWVSQLQGYNPVFNILAKPGYIDSIYLALQTVEYITCFKADAVPAYLNYGRHPRTLDLVVIADSSWSVVTGDRSVGKGAHGYDNTNREMDGIFFAYGPAFKKGYVSPTFENVDIYLLIANILDLDPVETDGDFERVRRMLR